MEIKVWQQIKDKLELIAKGYGKKFERVWFLNPDTNQEVDFLRFTEPNAANILPVTSEGFVIAVKQFRPGCEEITIELPGGSADNPNDDLVNVARRELFEETGYESDEIILLANGKPAFITALNSPSHGVSLLAFNCKKIIEPKMDPNEVLELVKFPVDQWVKMSLESLVDDPTLVTTLRALPFLIERYPSVLEVLK